MFGDLEELLQYIEINGYSEGRSYEYKSGLPWDKNYNEFRHKIIKAILSLSNLRDGGYVVIGVKQDANGKYQAVGIHNEDAKTYDREKVLESANSFADPFIDLDLKVFSFKDKSIVVVQVHEFKEIPVICKKNFQDILEQGRIYARTFRKPESTATITSSELREILELALMKQLTKISSILDLPSIRTSLDRNVQELYENERMNFE